MSLFLYMRKCSNFILLYVSCPVFPSTSYWRDCFFLHCICLPLCHRLIDHSARNYFGQSVMTLAISYSPLIGVSPIVQKCYVLIHRNGNIWFTCGIMEGHVNYGKIIELGWVGLGRASLVAQLIKNLSAMWETLVWSLGWEDPLKKGKATHSSILAWRIPWIVESMGSQRVGQDWATFTFTFELERWCSFIWDILNGLYRITSVQRQCLLC